MKSSAYEIKKVKGPILSYILCQCTFWAPNFMIFY